MARILIIEDSRVQAKQLERELALLPGCEGVELARDGLRGLELARSWRPDLIILDLILPMKDGLDVLRELRAGGFTRNIPVIVVTAKQTEVDEIVGFVLGADDYVIKPYRARVLAARVQTLLDKKKRPGMESSTVLERHGLAIDLVRHRATLRGQDLTLTPSEFSILELLLRRTNRICTRRDLIDALVGENGSLLEKTINVYVGHLREKLGDAGDLIETIRGVGYRLRDKPIE